MYSIASFFTSMEATIIFSVSIFLFAVWKWLFYYKEICTHKKAISQCSNKLAEYSSGDDIAKYFEELNSTLETIPYISGAWKSFKKTLVFTAKGNQNEAAIKTTVPSTYFLEPYTYLSHHINLSAYNAIPTYLTGLGILFTFVGLAAGIYKAQTGFASGSLSQITESLRQLLGGASLAFCTSIVGLVCSISFSGLSKRTLHGLTRKIMEVSKNMERLFPLITQESIALAQLEQLRTQTRQLQIFNTSFAVSIAEAIDSKISKQLITLVESIRNMLMTLINDTILPNLDRLNESVKKIRSDQSEALGELIKGIADSFLKSLHLATEKEFSQLADALRMLIGLVSETSITISLTKDSIIEAIKKQESEARQSLQEVLDLLIKSSNETKEELRITGKEIGQSIKESGQEIEAQIAKIVCNLSNTGDRLKENFEKINSIVDSYRMIFVEIHDLLLANAEEFRVTLSELKNAINSVRDVIFANQNSTKELERTIASLTGSIEQIVKINAEFLETSKMIKETAETFKSAQEEVSNTANTLYQERQALVSAWENYSQRFENLDHVLNEIFNQIQDGLNAYSIRVKDYLLELEKHMANALRTLGGAISELNESVEYLTESLTITR